MGRKAKITFEEKCNAIDNFLNNKKGIRELAREYQVVPGSVREWITNYQSMGTKGLLTQPNNSSYSQELKL